uniref:Uncharacterized protein n=1 Tax=Arundo donax TaxID=35708 RepID=A0A0A8Y7F5_ARUDO
MCSYSTIQYFESSTHIIFMWTI